MKICYAVFGWFSLEDGVPVSSDPDLAIHELQYPRASRCPFSGIIMCEMGEDGGLLDGYIDDRYGHAVVKGEMKGELDGLKLAFVKKYTHHQDEILYKLALLQEPGEQYRGRYIGEAVDGGETYIMLRRIPQSFFHP